MPSDTVWISDDVLYRSFQRFVSLSKSTRRYGSFVPGPLESRRRLGKRRMAQLSEPTPTSPYTFPPMWNPFGEVDRSKFKWEPPAAKTSGDDTTGVTDWLQGFITPAPSLTISESLDAIPAPCVSMSEEFTNADISAFQDTVRQASEDVVELCKDFSKRLKHSLILGETSSSTIITALGSYREVIPASGLRVSLLLTLFRDVWDGITACKVVPLSDIDGLVLEKLVNALSNLPMSLEVRALAHNIVCSASTAQLNKMRPSIIKLVDAWAQTWLADDCSSASEVSIVEAERAVHSVQLMLDRAHGLVVTSKQPIKSTHTTRPKQPNASQTKPRNGTLTRQRDRKILIELQNLSGNTRTGLYRSIEAIDLAESNLFPRKGSVSSLAEMLKHIDMRSGLLPAIINICSAHINKTANDALKGSRSVLRFHWLSLVAQMPNVTDDIFIRTIQLFEDHGKRHLTQAGTVPIILERWITQGVVKQPLIVRNEFKARERSQDLFVDLLMTLKKYNESWWTRTEDILELLRRLEKHNLVYNMLCAMHARRMRLPTPMIGRVLNDMSSFSVNKACSIYHMWLPTKPDRMPFRFWRCPNFVISMIQSTRISSEEIWNIMDIPIWDKNPKYHAFPGFSKDPNDFLSPGMVNLLTKMSIAFSKSRTSKAALREIARSIIYLRIRGNPIPPDVTKALTFSGITMPMIRDCWINEYKVGWALKMIEQAEGTAAAERVDKTVYLYKRQLLQKQAKRRKIADPPRFGWGRSI